MAETQTTPVQQNNDVQNNEDCLADEIHNTGKNVHKIPKEHLSLYALLIAVLVLALALLCVAVQRMDRRPPLELKRMLVHETCFPVSKNDLDTGVAYKKFELKFIRSSMLHHMKTERYNGISAMNLGIPLCYMLIKTDADNVLDMFNVNITGKSSSTISSFEGSPMCSEGAVYVTRWPSVYVEFMTDEGDVMEYVHMKGEKAIAVQHMFALEHGILPCHQQDHKATVLKSMVTSS